MARTGNTAHFHARRRLLLGAGALAALAACGGSGSSTAAHVKDRQIAVAPGTLRNLFPWLLQSDPALLAEAQATLEFVRPLRLADGDRLAAALPGNRHLVIHNGFHSDFFIEYERTVVDAIEAMRWEGLP